jgi:hypothetical protein
VSGDDDAATDGASSILSGCYNLTGGGRPQGDGRIARPPLSVLSILAQ